MCERTLSTEPQVKRIMFLSSPDEKGAQKVVSLDSSDPNRTIVGKTDGTRVRWSIPDDMWNYDDLEKLIGDLEAAQSE